ncbi:MAG: Coenzyme F420 hydrogenase/dehydrogenase, beta subunit C-terminal domain [Armatimonadota bacterium]
MEKELRAKAKELLESGQVKLVIGYETGSLPFKSTPCFAETVEETDKLVWNPTCVNNLAVYLPQAAAKGKTAVVVKPCDGKSVVELIKEHQIKREDVIVISVPCPGVINYDCLNGINPADINEISWNDGGISVKTSTDETSFTKEQFLTGKCRSCKLTEAPVADIKLGESPVREPLNSPFASLEKFESMSPAERRAFWAKQFEKCIRCYGCRQVCPACYCKECFVDKNGQTWASKATNTEANWFYHMGRAMHMAGRCIGCGECERACPMNIPIVQIYKKLHKDVAEMFDAAPGMDPDAAPILGSFDSKDPDPCPE